MVATCVFHIDCLEWQYDKAYVGNRLFGTNLVDQIHNRVQVFLHSCNTTSLDNVGKGMLYEFGKLQRHVEKGKLISSTPAWFNLPSNKDDTRRKSDSIGGMGKTQWNREEENNMYIDP